MPKSGYSCVGCGSETSDVQIERGRAGRWQTSTLCPNCQKKNYHSKYGSYIRSPRSPMTCPNCDRVSEGVRTHNRSIGVACESCGYVDR